MAQGALRQGLSGSPAVLFLKLFLQGAPIYADPDRDFPRLAGVCHRLYPLFPANISWVNADFINPLPCALQGQLVIKMDVCYQRDVDAALDGPDGLGRCHVWHCHPDDLTASRLQAVDLIHCGGDVIRLCAAHGLDGNWRTAAHGDAAHKNLIGHCPAS